MGDCFRPFRRKIGVLTLVLACVAMGGWLRSSYSTDMIMFQSPNALNRWISDKHGLVWTIHSQTKEALDEQEWDSLFGIPIPAICFAFPQSLDLNEKKYLNGNEWKRNWTILGFRFLEGQIRSLEQTVTVRIIPHWSVVIPLTLLSAFLLLSKSRKSNPKKIDEPFSEKLV